MNAAKAAAGPGLLERVAVHRVAAATAALIVLPWVTPYEALAVNILIYGIYAVGFNLLFGYLGMLSFGHAAFFGAGAYGCGIAVVHLGLPWWAAIPAGVLLAAAIAVVMGFLAIRTRGIYFAMVTLALSQIVYYGFYQAERWTGGENGLRGVNVRTIALPGVTLDFLDPLVRYYAILVFAVAALWLLSRVLDSPFGAVVEAIREREARARACGYDVATTRLIVFVISGAICGLAGALLALHLSIVPIELLHYQTSGLVVMMSLLGGMGTFFGPFIGAAAFLLIQDAFSLWTEHWQLYVGAIFIAFVLFFPRGIWGSLQHWVRR